MEPPEIGMAMKRSPPLVLVLVLHPNDSTAWRNMLWPAPSSFFFRSGDMKFGNREEVVGVGIERGAYSLELLTSEYVIYHLL